MSPPSRENVLRQFDEIGVWRRGDQRAPHKPLLILYALGRWQNGERGGISFHDVARDLGELLKEFGPPRQSQQAEYPFWRLQNDNIWIVQADGPVAPRAGQKDAKRSELFKHNARGTFAEPVTAAFAADPSLVGDIARQLLNEHFPDSVHSDILEAVGLTIGPPGPVSHARDSGFRKRVLKAYEYRCSVCGYNVRLGANLLGLEAAHIKWHQAGGPDSEINGLALCPLHHKSFDLGAFTVRADLMILVSDEVNGSCGVEEVLMRHHATALREPQRPEHRPMQQFLDWHLWQVFKGTSRHVK